MPMNKWEWWLCTFAEVAIHAEVVVHIVMMVVVCGYMVRQAQLYSCYFFRMGIGVTHSPAIGWNLYLGLFD